jgi:hypothetical protein
LEISGHNRIIKGGLFMELNEDLKNMCPECKQKVVSSENTLCDACGSKKKPSMDSAERVDSYMPTEWMANKFEKTPEGYLKGRAIVTNIGVFQYRNMDGSTRKELRLPEEVFAYDSLESLKLKPVTNDHPSESVNNENVKDLSVGSTGSNVTSTTQAYSSNGQYIPSENISDGIHVAVDMVVTDASAVVAVEEGKAALSCGYNCDLELAKPGSVYMGMPYDYIQRNIRYNHVAIVDAARAGDNAKIRLDSMDSNGAVLMNKEHSKKEDTQMVLKKVHLDGVDYDAEAPVITALVTAKDRADKAEDSIKELTATISSTQAEKDTALAKVDSLSKELEEVKAAQLDQSKIDSAVEAKLKLVKTATLAGVEVKDGMTDAEITVAVIKSAFPSANLDGKDSVYLAARFDGAVEMLSEKKENNSDVQTVVSGEFLGQPKADSSDARKRYVDQFNKK